MSQVFLVYHKGDLDGQCSAAITYKYVLENIVERKEEDIILVPMEYGEQFPYSIKEVIENNLFIFIDFILQPFEQMLNFNPNNLILIDHHKTTIENLALHLDWKPDGLIGDLNNKKSVAQLAWDFFYPGEGVPAFIQYISYYKMGENNFLKEEKDFLGNFEDILAFYEGLMIAISNFDEDKQSWLDLINWSINKEEKKLQNAYFQFCDETIRWGKKFLRYKKKYIKED